MNTADPKAFNTSPLPRRPVSHIPREQTAAEKLRRHAMALMRELAQQYPGEYADIGKELLPRK